MGPLTIKLDEPVLDALHPGSVTLLGLEDTQLLRSSTHEPENAPESKREDGCQDDERSISPTPATVLEKGFTKLWTGLSVENGCQ